VLGLVPPHDHGEERPLLLPPTRHRYPEPGPGDAAVGGADLGLVRGVLLAAALAAPATGHADRQRKATATIASGLRAGAAKPRHRRDGAP
jgi:hypothetical protein